MSVFHILDIATKGLQAYLRALQVTSNNVANANTPGYSRQRVVLTENQPIDMGSFFLPTGVSIAQIERAFDPAIFKAILQRQSLVGQSTIEKSAFTRIEGFSNEINGKGLIEALRNFFQALSNFASNTNSTTFKNLVISDAEIVTDTLKTYINNLDKLLADFQNTITDKVSIINSKLEEIANLNEQIVQAEVGGNKKGIANELRDKREQALREISQFMNVSFLEDQIGNLNITTGGEILVSRNKASKLKVLETIENNQTTKKVIIENTGGFITPESGELGAILKLNEKINEIKSNLENIFRGLVFEFNKLYSTGAGREVFTYVSSNIPFAQTSLTNVLSKEIEVNAKNNFEIQANSLIGFADGSFKDYYIIKQTKSGGQILAKVKEFAGASGTILTDRKINVNKGEKLILSSLPFTITNGSFDLVAVDTNTNTEKIVNIPITLFGLPTDDNLTSLVSKMNTIFTSNNLPFTASITDDNSLQISSSNPLIKFYFNNDTSNLLSASQINPFFRGFSLDNFEVNTGLRNNLNQLSYAENFLAQDNLIALKLSQLATTAIFDTGESIESKLINFFGNLANQINQANTNFEMQNDLLVQLDNERDKISGVNLDEEAANLIVYQKAFQANAKVVQVANDILDTLLKII
jgi:flagellar hook-associated protein 1